MRTLSSGEQEILESLVEQCGLQYVIKGLVTIAIGRANELSNDKPSKMMSLVTLDRKKDSLRWEAIAFQFNRLLREAEHKGL